MNRGVEIAADVADLPRRLRGRPGAQRRRRAHGGAVPAAGFGRHEPAQPRELWPMADDRAWCSRAADRRRRRRSARPTCWSSDDGRIVGRRSRPRRRRRSLDAGGVRSWPRVSSTCTPTSASPARRRPRRSRPAPGRRRSAGYTARGGHAEHHAGHRLRRGRARGARARARARCATS